MSVSLRCRTFRTFDEAHNVRSSERERESAYYEIVEVELEDRDEGVHGPHERTDVEG